MNYGISTPIFLSYRLLNGVMHATESKLLRTIQDTSFYKGDVKLCIISFNWCRSDISRKIPTALFS